jgi:hypothetical protein
MRLDRLLIKTEQLEVSLVKCLMNKIWRNNMSYGNCDHDKSTVTITNKHRKPRHECPDWDYMVIDSGSPEIDCCLCTEFCECCFSEADYD